MVRVDAGWIIAVVADIHPLGNGSDKELVGNTVSTESSVIRGVMNQSVPSSSLAASPDPAPKRRLLHLPHLLEKGFF